MDATRDPLYQRLFRVFCWLSEGEVGLTPARASFLIEETHRLAGHASTSRRLAFNGESVSFREILGLLENQFSDKDELGTAALALFERYVDQILVKGFVLYRRRRRQMDCRPWHRPATWQTGWYQVSPGSLQLCHVQGDRLVPKLTIPLELTSNIEVLHLEERIVCKVSNGKQQLELSNFDGTNGLMMENVIRLAAAMASKEALMIADRRTAARFNGREEELEAEEKLKLEREKAKLQRQLEEERQALRDEEIVRGLATRMLEEERLKSEQMEKVLQELQMKLHEREEEDLVEYVADQMETSVEKSVEYQDALEEEHRLLLAGDESGEDVWQKEDFLIMSTQSI